MTKLEQIEEVLKQLVASGKFKRDETTQPPTCYVLKITLLEMIEKTTAEIWSNSGHEKFLTVEDIWSASEKYDFRKDLDSASSHLIGVAEVGDEETPGTPAHALSAAIFEGAKKEGSLFFITDTVDITPVRKLDDEGDDSGASVDSTKQVSHALKAGRE